jgi:hypothetical protein
MDQSMLLAPAGSVAVIVKIWECPEPEAGLTDTGCDWAAIGSAATNRAQREKLEVFDIAIFFRSGNVRTASPGSLQSDDQQTIWCERKFLG